MDIEEPERRRRVLIVAYAAHPDASMESRVGWHRAIECARDYETWVLYGDDYDRAELARLARLHEPTHPIRFVRASHGAVGRRLVRSPHLFWQGYALWHRRAFHVARRLHDRWNFDLVHQVSFCGYREPGYTWQLPAPFVIGPVGGTHNFPLAFLSQLDLGGALRELARNVANFVQFRYRRRVARAYRQAAVVLAANRTAQQDLQKVLGVSAERQLETGIAARQLSAGSGANGPDEADRRRPGEPLRILWAGRLRSWKALPLLLKALSQMPSDVDYQVRVLGEGPCEKRWKDMAARLGVASHLEWVGWPAYDETIPQYRWADVFAFTSLRDTSGTGLLESLAAGVPIVGLDHQGAADIMTDRCAVKIPAVGPAAAIAALRDALAALATQPDRLSQLKHGARQRASEYLWERQGERMAAVYRAILANEGCTAVLPHGQLTDEAGPGAFATCVPPRHNGSLAPGHAAPAMVND